MRQPRKPRERLGSNALLAASLQYSLIQGKMYSEDLARLELYNRAYSFWKRFWSDTFKQNGTNDEPSPDDFLRQDYIGVVERNGEPIALHAHTIFDLRQMAAREHSYFARYCPPAFINAIETRGANRVITMECYSVAREWRALKLGVSIAAVMVGLGLKLAEHERTDAGIAIARSDVGADHLGHAHGAITLQAGINIHNTPCALIAFFPELVHPHENEGVRHLVDYFWRERKETVEQKEYGGLKIAA